eukprot:scaffold173861_cov47-Prasinocladus_malaysianus.AAC.1
MSTASSTQVTIASADAASKPGVAAQIRSEVNFDFTQGGMLHELCIRLTRTNLGVKLGTEDIPEIPTVNVVFLCMTTTPESAGVFVDNTDGTYSIVLPRINDLTDSTLTDDLAASLPYVVGNPSEYDWYSNIVLSGTHTLEITAIDVVAIGQDPNAAPMKFSKMPYTDGMVHLPAPTHQDYVIVRLLTVCWLLLQAFFIHHSALGGCS